YGAFRFVCTNLGGRWWRVCCGVPGGARRQDPIDEIAEELATSIAGFDAIAALYQHWAERPLNDKQRAVVPAELPKRVATITPQGSAARTPPCVKGSSAGAAFLRRRPRVRAPPIPPAILVLAALLVVVHVPSPAAATTVTLAELAVVTIALLD